MEAKEKILESEDQKEDSGRSQGTAADSRLLQELIDNSSSFILTQDIQLLSETLKRCFFHGLALDKYVSTRLDAIETISKVRGFIISATQITHFLINSDVL